MKDAPAPFTRYEKFVIAVIALLQFTVIMDFMVLSPLGAFLLPKLGISTAQFGMVVSVYGISAGISGILAAGFADRFDRKKLLLFFYFGFVLGTLYCGIADDYRHLLLARVITGTFGGVIGSVSMAIIADIFPMEVRGRVMGVVQMSFAACQVLGIPVGLYLSTLFDWHAPFLLIVAVAAPAGILIMLKLQPVVGHLNGGGGTSAFDHLWRTASNRDYLRGYLATMLLATGGFMIMPFSSAFMVNNILVPEKNLFLIFLVTGLSSLFTGPVLGILGDKIGKFRLFAFGSVITTVMVFLYTNMGPSPIWMVASVNTILWVGISSRMISSTALTSGVPDMQDRGAYMGINSSMQYCSGAAASYIAGLIVHQPDKASPLQHYDIVGYATILTMILTVAMMYRIDRQVSAKLHRLRV